MTRLSKMRLFISSFDILFFTLFSKKSYFDSFFVCLLRMSYFWLDTFILSWTQLILNLGNTIIEQEIVHSMKKHKGRMGLWF